MKSVESKAQPLSMTIVEPSKSSFFEILGSGAV